MTTSSASVTQKRATKRRQFEGVVVSTKMAKTAVIRVDRRVAHAKYGKYYTVSRKFKIHDADSKAKLGDVVLVEETRPLSRDKCWKYIETVKSAA